MLLAWGEKARPGVEHTVSLVQGVGGTPAPVVEFLLDAPAALIESITGKAHDMEGIHDRPRAGEFFDGGTLKAGESIHRDDLNALTPRVGLGGQLGFEDPLGATRDHVQKPGGTTTVSYRSQIQDDGDVPVPIRGVAPHVFIHANDTHPFTPSWIIDQQTRPFSQDSSVRGSSRTRPGPGRRAPVSHDEQPRPSAPSAPPHARAWHADRPLDSCLGATRKHTLGTGSGARSHARSWGATRKAHAPSA